jgi:hypothetical protein
MPLLDHFRPQLAPRRHWESFHVKWAGAIADTLNEDLLPEGYFAEEHAQIGPWVEIDAATFADESQAGKNGPADGRHAVAARAWAPPAPGLVLPAAFPDSFEVLVFQTEGGTRLVAAIELVSPANKDRAAHRRAFTVKCASYLAQGIGLVIVDIVTTRQANLHNEMMTLLEHEATSHLPAEASLYAVAYRPVVRQQAELVEVWPAILGVGQALPTLPLALNSDICLPIDLEGTYAAACRRRRLT